MPTRRDQAREITQLMKAPFGGRFGGTPFTAIPGLDPVVERAMRQDAARIEAARNPRGGGTTITVDLQQPPLVEETILQQLLAPIGRTTPTGLASMDQDTLQGGAGEDEMLPEILYGAPGQQVGGSNLNALMNMANRGNVEALKLIGQIRENETATRRLNASQNYKASKERQQAQEKAANAELAMIDKIAEKENWTVEQRSNAYQQVQGKYVNSTLPNPYELTSIIAAEEDRNVLLAQLQDKIEEYESTRSPSAKAAAMRIMTQAGLDANKWEDQQIQRSKSEREDKAALYTQEVDRAKLESSFEYTTAPTRRNLPIIGGSLEPTIPGQGLGRFDLKAENPFDEKDNPGEFRRFEMVRQRKQAEFNDRLLSIHERMFGALPSTDSKQATKAVQAATESQTPAPAREGGAAGFASVNDAKAAASSGRVEIGKPFPVNVDGTVSPFVLLSNGQIVPAR